MLTKTVAHGLWGQAKFHHNEITPFAVLVGVIP
jgi:hypothetical protein